MGIGETYTDGTHARAHLPLDGQGTALSASCTMGRERNGAANQSSSTQLAYIR